MAVAVAVSAGLGMLIMVKSSISVSEHGFNRHFLKSASKVLFYIPLLVIELIPIVVFGFSGDIPPSLYIAVAFFTIAVGFNEEIYFRGLALKILGEKGVKKAIVWSSIMFGLLHMANALNGKNLEYIILQISFAFLVGFVLAEIVSITKSIWVVIVWHTAHDFIAMTTQDISNTTAFVLLATQTIILLIYAIVLWKKVGIKKDRLNKQIIPNNKKYAMP